ncbi:hypothetical protein BD410DRAFT_841868 [Rickenella mellea]|uniref:Uncharacterized protein n=1 Tax=Rickenella mellea TaxID=50990 RepID=A0A4Y7PYU8_9AGAM|nr:hypothetical protein BD410DRAFT_841868 [Rickenella mellea]
MGPHPCFGPTPPDFPRDLAQRLGTQSRTGAVFHGPYMPETIRGPETSPQSSRTGGPSREAHHGAAHGAFLPTRLPGGPPLATPSSLRPYAYPQPTLSYNRPPLARPSPLGPYAYTQPTMAPGGSPLAGPSSGPYAYTQPSPLPGGPPFAGPSSLRPNVYIQPTDPRVFSTNEPNYPTVGSNDSEFWRELRPAPRSKPRKPAPGG